jgi:hypothetical protein
MEVVLLPTPEYDITLSNPFHLLFKGIAVMQFKNSTFAQFQVYTYHYLKIIQPKLK